MRSNADLAMQVEALQERMEALHCSLELTTRRLQEIGQEISAARSRSLAAIPPVIVRSGRRPGRRGSGRRARLHPLGAVVDSELPPEQLYRAA